MTSRRPPLSICRWLMLAALALSVVLQPVLGSVSELHELSHGAASVHIDCRWAAPQRDARSGKWRQVLRGSDAAAYGYQYRGAYYAAPAGSAVPAGPAGSADTA